MSINSGININVNDLILYLDVFNTPTWNLGRRLWTDLSSKKNNVTFIGSILPTVSNTDGYIEFANGVNHHLRYEPDNESEVDFVFGTGDFTIEAWIYPLSFSTYTHIFCLEDQNTFALKANVTDGRVYFTSSSFSTFNDITDWTLNLNQWNQVVLKRESNIAYCYLNGSVVGLKNNFNNDISAQYPVLIRNGGNVSEFSNTRFKQLLVYKRALSDVEISLHYRVFNTRSYIPATSAGTLLASSVVSSISSVVGENLDPVIPVRGSGGIGQLTYSISPALPDGVSFNINDGEISGRPVGTSNTSYTVTISDAAGNSQSQNFNLVITVPPVVATRPQGTYNLLVNSNVSIVPIIAEGGFGALTYSISPALPTGLSLSVGTGVISGTATSILALTTYTVTVADSITPTPQTDSVTIQIQVSPAPLNVLVGEDISTSVGASINIIPVSGSGGFGALTYSISPSLPSGLSFNTSNGTISGTPTTGLSQTQFTVTITDEASQTVNGSFNITILASLYAFTTFTFGNANTTGRLPPSKSELLASYDTISNPWLNNTSFYDVITPGIQEWTVPQTGIYEIEASGAAGGVPYDSTGRIGLAAIVTAAYELTQGQKIRIVVGQRGRPIATNNPDGPLTGLAYNSGGGGGTFVFFNISDSQPLIAAGGGGGGAFSGNPTLRPNASINLSGEPGTYVTNEGQLAGSGLITGQTLGSGGVNLNNTNYKAGGGAGWNANGSGGHSVCNAQAPFHVQPGWSRNKTLDTSQSTTNGGPFYGGWGGNNQAGNGSQQGGFGGGGGGTGRCGSCQAGGGGGYTGGGISTSTDNTPTREALAGGGNWVSAALASPPPFVTLQIEPSGGFVKITKV